MEFGDHFGFGDLRPVELVDLEYQISQKLHAVTDPDYVRAHDLVDLQLLWLVGPDLSVLRQMCVRTFAFRSQQSWPPLPLRPMDDWSLAYVDARDETLVDGATPILATLDEARTWLADKVREIDEVGAEPGA
ncbi:nucleotidyl transferase AbiEii/AbiGii toxin family protein [Isoptericola sp. NPDC055881]